MCSLTNSFADAKFDSKIIVIYIAYSVGPLRSLWHTIPGGNKFLARMDPTSRLFEFDREIFILGKHFWNCWSWILMWRAQVSRLSPDPGFASQAEGYLASYNRYFCRLLFVYFKWKCIRSVVSSPSYSVALYGKSYWEGWPLLGPRNHVFLIPKVEAGM
jgi:hypothetical protein